MCGSRIGVGLIALKELHRNGHDLKEGFFSDFGDRLILSAVVPDLLEFGFCGKAAAEVLISWSEVFSAFSAQLG